MQPHDTCLVCKGRVLTRKFCVFPCILNGKQCMYHEDCLASEVLNIADAATRREIRQLQQKIAAQDPGSGGAESLRKQLSEVLTADCPACGELLVDTIDRPFEGGQRFD